MRDDYETMFYLPAGPLAAIVLGMALVPLREITTASNLTYAFVVLTIVVAEYGGRWPAVATALCSALSLNFFLTRPYLTLTIEKTDDIIAFAGLTICGLIVAVLGSRRRRQASALAAARRQLDLLHSTLTMDDPSVPLKTRLTHLLEASRKPGPRVGSESRQAIADVARVVADLVDREPS
jgi:K+-sensing histidine kinase KdpD